MLINYILFISLNQSEALAPDQGPFTPYVAGLSLAERDEVISNLDKTFPKYIEKISKRTDDISQEEISIKESLLRLNWENSPAHFLTTSWKKSETAWISPWLKNFGGNFFLSLILCCYILLTSLIF